MRTNSEKYRWGLDFSEIARIWTNGCIIRSEFMQELVELFNGTDQLLLAPAIEDRLKEYQKDLRAVVAKGLNAGFALPVSTAALNYLLGLTTADSPANLIQAQRDHSGRIPTSGRTGMRGRIFIRSGVRLERSRKTKGAFAT